MTTLQNFVDKFGLGISKDELIINAYHQLKADGYKVCILNSKYIIINGKSYRLIKSRKENRWIVKEF